MTGIIDHDTEVRAALASAARRALRAPSVFNTQPWIWRINGTSMELCSDPARQLENTDPDGQLLLLSCGAALHHARTALAAAGWQTQVDRLPDPARPCLLARIRIPERVPADPATTAMAAAINRRRTDRRAFGLREVSGPILDELRRMVEAEGAYLHLVRHDQIAMLAISTELAAAAELDDPDYRVELERWTSRPAADSDGVPAGTAVRPGLRRVPIRDFAPDGTAGLEAGGGRDQGAAYVVVFGTGTTAMDLLRGGEALSALLLRATAEGLATAPLSDAVEVTWPRHLLRGLLAGMGEPRPGHRDREVSVPHGSPQKSDPTPPSGNTHMRR
jgi:hypothetical protein